MIPGNVDPRRPEKVQRYKPPSTGNGGAPGEDLTPDYMNILGPESTTGNAQGDSKFPETVKKVEPRNPQPDNMQPSESTVKVKNEASPSNLVNSSPVVPNSPQYGVAIIPTTTANDIPCESATLATVTITEATPKTTDIETKDLQSVPSKTDRFKVVKIASSEPFRRGRWKCMDYVDQAPPVTTQQSKTTTQAGASIQLGGNMYMQTQSLPPQQIQQLLLQGGFTAATPQFFQANMQSQMIPQAQYFYPPVQNQGNVPQQNLHQQILNPGVVSTNSVQPQFIAANQQPFFQPGAMSNAALHNFQNLQFMQQAYQNSAFVPTTQNFQQGQTYAGQPTTQQAYTEAQQNIPATQPQSQPIINGYVYPQQSANEQQIATSSTPTQATKNIILNSNGSPHVNQNTVLPQLVSVPSQQDQNPSVPLHNSQVSDQNPLYPLAQVPQNIIMQAMSQVIPNITPQHIVTQSYDPSQPIDTYGNPQLITTIQAMPVVQSLGDGKTVDGMSETANVVDSSAGSSDDPAKTNPVVNAIDNKIEQAMDLVKSHLMYTVREEVEVLKEKIAELMERIQQLETENNFLRSQIPKNTNNCNSTGTPDPSPQQ